jgi:carboxyl-terminal processing protease
MNKRIWIFVLIPILVSSLACQAVFGVFNPTPTPTLTSTFTPLPPTSTPSPSPTVEPPTATPIPPTLTPTPTETLTRIPVTASPGQLSVFERLWQIINTDYLYPDFNGADWDALHVEYRQKVEAGLTPDEFYATMNELILQLGDEHSFYLSPEQVAEQEAEFNGVNDYVGVGIYTLPVPERKRVTIILTFPGGPAELAGLKSHDSILEVDGQPILDENGIRVQLLRGPEGSQVTLTVESPGQEPRQVTLTRERIQ